MCIVLFPRFSSFKMHFCLEEMLLLIPAARWTRRRFRRRRRKLIAYSDITYSRCFIMTQHSVKNNKITCTVNQRWHEPLFNYSNHTMSRNGSAVLHSIWCRVQVLKSVSQKICCKNYSNFHWKKNCTRFNTEIQYSFFHVKHIEIKLTKRDQLLS